MALIDSGDLAFDTRHGSMQAQLFHAIRDKVVHNLWPTGGKLPSTRQLAQELRVSRNTVIAAYEQLVAEGYIESRPGAGFYVAVELPEFFLPAQRAPESVTPIDPALGVNRPFAPGVPDLAQFPLAKWQRLLQRHASRTTILGNHIIQGRLELRTALADYLASSRSVHCDAGRIIITSGAQQALSIAIMATLSAADTLLMEQPGYSQMRKINTLLGIHQQPVAVVEKTGLDVSAVLKSDARALYITPSNQYPMGTTLNTAQRLSLIEWAASRQSWIIEDDYDSEFQFAHRPFTSLQGLAGQMGMDERVLYVGSFSKVMFNGLRLGYLVVPDCLVERCLMIKDALSGDSPAHTQAALADFIVEGDLLRHIRKMRRLYKSKHAAMCEAIACYFADKVEIISQAAGLHITIKWQQGIDEVSWAQRAEQKGIIIRPLGFYEPATAPFRGWHGVVLGFGNVALEDIAPKIRILAELFHD